MKVALTGNLLLIKYHPGGGRKKKQTEVRRKRWLRNIAGSWELDLNGNIIKQKGKMDIKLKQKLEEIFLELMDGSAPCTQIITKFDVNSLLYL